MSYGRPVRTFDANGANSSKPAYAPALAQTAENNVPACVSALLDQTRRLETALQRWAALEITENEVSDVFVTVGNTFHAMLAAFAVWNIDMRNVEPFLSDLRRVLEDCLSEDPTPSNVAYLLPQVRAIIAALLTGLKDRKDAYWQAVRARSGSSASTPVSGGW